MPLTRGCATRCCRCFPRSTSSERAGSACGSRACPPSLIVTGSSTPSARRSTHGRRRTRTCASSTSPTCARTHGARQPRLRRRCRQGRPINLKRLQPRRRGRRRRQPRLVHRRNFRFVARRALQAPCALLHRGRRLTRRPVGGNSAYRAPRPGDTTGAPSWYDTGHHSLPHTDWVGQRTVAYVWHLSKNWKPEWGGVSATVLDPAEGHRKSSTLILLGGWAEIPARMTLSAHACRGHFHACAGPLLGAA